MALSPLNQRRWRNFTANRRAYWSLWLFAALFGLSLFAEVLANDKPLLVHHQGGYYTPFLKFYPETAFGGDFHTEAAYRDPEVQCLIVAPGSDACWDDPEGILAEAQGRSVQGQPITPGWILWPPIPYSYNTINNIGGAAPSAPDMVYAFVLVLCTLSHILLVNSLTKLHGPQSSFSIAVNKDRKKGHLTLALNLIAIVVRLCRFSSDRIFDHCINCPPMVYS